MSSPRVMKFGGAALADGRAIRAVCGIVTEELESGAAPPLVVVSAHAGVTDQLEALGLAAARGRPDPGPVRVRHRSLLTQLGLSSDLLDRYWRALDASLAQVAQRGALVPAELDRILSFGERLSARVVARALADRGVEATPVDAWDLGLVTDSRHGGARPLDGCANTIAKALAAVPGVPVVTGFLAKDAGGQLTTLGRNGSDLTAAILAEAVGARELVYWKAVAGILTADPLVVPEARLLPELSFDEASALATLGARVLHPDAIAPARRAGVPVRVACVTNPGAPGTLLVEHTPPGPKAVTCIADLRVVRVAPAREREAARLLSGPGWLTRRRTAAQVELLVRRDDGLRAVLEALGGEASIVRDVAAVALVGAGVGSDADLIAAATDRLTAPDVQDDRLLFLIEADDLPRAVSALHGLLPTAATARN